MAAAEEMAISLVTEIMIRMFVPLTDILFLILSSSLHSFRNARF